MRLGPSVASEIARINARPPIAALRDRIHHVAHSRALLGPVKALRSASTLLRRADGLDGNLDRARDGHIRDGAGDCRGDVDESFSRDGLTMVYYNSLRMA